MTAPNRLDPSALGELLQDVATEERLQNNWRAIQLQRAEVTRPPRMVAPMALAAAAAVLLAVGGWLLWPRTEPGALLLADGGEWSDVAAAGSLLSDGSRIESDGARLEVLENSGDRVALSLGEGQARFSIVPNGPRRWQVVAGPVTVEVVGTVFSVQRGEDDAVSVEVERGVVLVRSEALPDRVQRLTAGQSLDVREPQTELGVEPTAEPAPSADEPEVDEAPEQEPGDELAVLAPASPRAVRRARPVAEPSPPDQAERSAIALLAEANQARAEGRVADAVDTLERLLRLHRGSQTVALAAYLLGRVEMSRSRFDAAADALRRALAEGMPRTNAQAAHELYIQALARAGRRSEAAAAAEEYEARFPNGRHAEVRRWLAD